ncbi:MAG TPA: Mur ligase domain-containing protein [Spirochaetota bacterium]|nr:UDP-N-acetylmuramate:L-alanyl-gamma-D-glutamyl-meso-diaminopimelate ligase [Spirochaetota bacterium]HOD16183.1 Mur ligase domain-containing protein [Spirochaetota bacterium]HPG51856.1 Mur ligase domain-containing protein [Spirochaetota bacterium]HPN14159.1 Mur ligase domain-containing protein [Spirochaetota bacterium]
MIGICGVAMGTLASMLHEQGHVVSGSDRDIYPPMSDLLRKSGMKLHNGFSAGQVGSPDLVIVGNAISRGNPEVEHVLNRRIPYMSMAQALRDFFLAGKEVIAVAGTHGKSTTTALLAHLLESTGMDPSFFVGGVSRNHDANYRLGSGRHFIIEGDEYDSAFFEKVPKFIFYRPSHLVITSLEFDHADIYRDLAEIELWFRRLVNIVPSEGCIVYSSDYPNLADIVAKSHSRTLSYGGPGADVAYAFRGYSGTCSDLRIERPGGVLDLRSEQFGHFNYANITAAVAMAGVLGADDAGIRRGVESFLGVKRRQELVYRGNGTIVYDDFAHHPTAISSVLSTMRERYPDARIWAVYEPRSATSRRNVFQDILPAAFRAADVILIKTPFEGSAVREGEKLDPDRLLRDIRAFNRDSHLFPETEDILEHIKMNLAPGKDNVIVIMSNGGFDGIYEKLRVMLEELYPDRSASACGPIGAALNN